MWSAFKKPLVCWGADVYVLVFMKCLGGVYVCEYVYIREML